MPSHTTPERALQAWRIEGAVLPVGAGHINDTYIVDVVAANVVAANVVAANVVAATAAAVENAEAAQNARYVLQRVNGFVFEEPLALMRNLRKVLPNVRELTVAPLPARDGRDCWVDPMGDLWRVYPYVEHRAFQSLPDELVHAAGVIFGRLLQKLKTLRVDLEPVIEGFHDVDKYLGWLDGVRTPGVADAELDYVDTRKGSVVSSAQRQIIHGDCKINNILFDPDRDEARYVVDLDTLMLGDASWDYGDLVRSVCAGAEESRADVQGLAMPRIESVTRGFFSQYLPAGVAAGVVTSFSAAPGHMSFMLGVRFLADHLDGDRYFKVEHRGQNLDRARTQFILARNFDALSSRISETIDEAISTP